MRPCLNTVYDRAMENIEPNILEGVLSVGWDAGPAPEINDWDIGRAEISDWFAEIPTDTFNGFQQQSLLNCWEGIHRFADSRDRLEDLRRRYPKNHDEIDGIKPGQQHDLFEATEAFFARYYATISRIAALTTRWSPVFSQTPVGSMAKFIKWLERRFDAPGYFSPAEDARRFRAVLEHPEQHQEYAWMTVTIGGGPMHIALYGPASSSGAIPEGAAAKHLDDGPGWDIAAPYENFVFNNTALALHACLWQIKQHVEGRPLTSPIVKLGGLDAEGRRIEIPSLEASNAHGKIVFMNGGPVTVPGTSGPPQDDPITHEGISFGRVR